VLQFGILGSRQQTSVTVWDYSKSTTSDVAAFDIELNGSCGTAKISGATTAFGYNLSNWYTSASVANKGPTLLIGIYGGD
jgi:hypothetical protein